ncbi:MAG: von Willebrand factor type A domain-containing protein [Cyclobacteriaceae bacterium]|nr:von Willebrand factor type A domain-containing protein [Cyclobacteriaceae bacterium]
MKTKWTLIWLMMTFAGQLTGQSRMISGRVTSGEDGSPLAGVNVLVKGTTVGTVTNESGRYSISVPSNGRTLIFSFIGLQTKEVQIGNSSAIDVSLFSDIRSLSEVVVTGYAEERESDGSRRARKIKSSAVPIMKDYEAQPQWNTEEYDGIQENIFHGAPQNPLSTFSIDVDAASYSNVRRYIQSGQRPPVDAVRVEEMINYFDYNYKNPENETPFSVYTEISTAPWNEKHKLVHIGLQGKKIPTNNLPASNLVFLIDVSGSMSDPNKLPLLKASFKLLVDQLRAQDRVAIVVYAGAAGLVLPSTSGAEKRTITDALDNLEAGGSTAGGAGIHLAYAVAKENLRPNGNNRVILATDGDFNVGESSNGGMERLIEKKREDGIFLTVLGFGMGNYKDSKMEILADKGNGNYAYIDNILEAQKVLVNEFGGTMFTIAKDVKLQVEFNPARVQAYRLIGYENRALKNEDFNNDKKDAGELGSGHTVTALYEIIPQGVTSEFYKIDELKYQQTSVTKEGASSKELMTIKLRYKEPSGNESKLIVHPLMDRNTLLTDSSEDFRWSASVAAFGMLLRDSEFVKGFTFDDVLQLAQGARGVDKEGHRAEFIRLVKSMGLVASR